MILLRLSHRYVSLISHFPLHCIIIYLTSNTCNMSDVSKGLVTEKVISTMVGNGEAPGSSSALEMIGQMKTCRVYLEDCFICSGPCCSGNLFLHCKQKPSKAKYYVDETSEVPKLLYICHVLIFTSSNQNIIRIFIIVTRTRIIEPTGKIFQFKVSVINWRLMLRRKLRKGYFPNMIF